LLLDEPLNGIDPGGRREINNLLTQLAARGKTILVSSHILTEVEHLADTVLMISAGRIVAAGRLSEVRAQIEEQPFTVEIAADDSRRLAALLIETPEVRSLEVRDDVLVVRTRNPAQFFSRLNGLVVDRGLAVRRIETTDAGADAVFDYLQSR
jgi:ABC-2 type transport system ATP-binding protein